MATDNCQELIRALFAPIFVARRLNTSSIRPPHASMGTKKLFSESSPEYQTRTGSPSTRLSVKGNVENGKQLKRIFELLSRGSKSLHRNLRRHTSRMRKNEDDMPVLRTWRFPIGIRMLQIWRVWRRCLSTHKSICTPTPDRVY